MEDLDTTKYAKGFRFNPFDDELIDDYLKPRITNKQLPCNLIKDKDVYGDASNPWSVFDSNHWFRFPGLKSTEKCVYVFARLSKLSKSNTGKNTSKTAGCGTWAGKGKQDKILDSQGRLIGEKKYLVFEINELDSVQADGMDLSKIGQYKMHEFSLSGQNTALNSDAAATIVLCRITHDSSKVCTINLKSKSGTKNAQKVEGTSNVTTENLTVLESDVGEHNNVEGTSNVTTENLTVLESDVSECSAPAQFGDDFWEGITFDEVGNANFCFGELGSSDICLDDLGCSDFCFDNRGGEDMCSGDLGDWDIDRIREFLDTNQQEETLQGTSSKLGKRKFELEENSYQAKKMCLNPY
ncbi:hypothetical protein POM88_042659 [Heracleum sosnowskyi]|uniref:NAC domain-containing protein n=1 Tax=Heracleum sosnowskyi TaxID=360622 RepID=A0AAD8MCE6_9APIA|nr:hypothetical protein POM88_042659 [Heracleum sosnowskyi]